MIGRVPWSRPVPPRQSGCWTDFCNALDTFIEIPGFATRRSPGWLYRRIHGKRSQQRITWGDFRPTGALSCEGLKTLVTISDTKSNCMIISWNARWLVDASAEHGIAKREVISMFLAKGAIVCVQETHWNDSNAAIWPHGLLFTNLHYSTAVEGRLLRNQHTENEIDEELQGRCGGVATFLPPGCTLNE